MIWMSWQFWLINLGGKQQDKGQKEVAPMFPCSGVSCGYCWIAPVIMICMMFLCFFMMRRRIGSTMCSLGPRGTGKHAGNASEAALDILNKRFARGEIGKEKYEEKRNIITRRN
jgi:uncharacterized membrane protein